jgi:cytoskeletal protein RodZ
MDGERPTVDPMSPRQEQEKSASYPKNYDYVAPDYHKEKHAGRNIAIVVIILILLTGGAGAYWFFVMKKPATNTSSSQTNQPVQTTPSNKIASDTKNHDSTNFSLSFDYPEDWKVSDVTGSGKLTATSPAMQLTGADNQQVTGQIVLTFREPSQKLSEFDKGNATAVRDSEKIAYAKPSAGQRGSTYISFLGYSGAEATALDGVYVTGDSGYQKDQAIPAVDIGKVNPVIAITFLKCADPKCSDAGTPFAVQNTVWDDAAFSGPLKNLLQSLSVH